MGGNSARGCALFGPTKSIRAGEKLFACDSLCFGSLRFTSFARVKADAARRPRQGLAGRPSLERRFLGLPPKASQRSLILMTRL